MSPLFMNGDSFNKILEKMEAIERIRCLTVFWTQKVIWNSTLTELRSCSSHISKLNEGICSAHLFEKCEIGNAFLILSIAKLVSYFITFAPLQHTFSC